MLIQMPQLTRMHSGGVLPAGGCAWSGGGGVLPAGGGHGVPGRGGSPCREGGSLKTPPLLTESQTSVKT